MGKLFDEIRRVVQQDRYLLSWHADERCEERGISAWQIVAGIEEATLLEERLRDRPCPSVRLGQVLADGAEIEVVWSWVESRQQARLVTVCFLDRE